MTYLRKDILRHFVHIQNLEKHQRRKEHQILQTSKYKDSCFQINTLCVLILFSLFSFNRRIIPGLSRSRTPISDIISYLWLFYPSAAVPTSH